MPEMNVTAVIPQSRRDYRSSPRTKSGESVPDRHFESRRDYLSTIDRGANEMIPSGLLPVNDVLQLENACDGGCNLQSMGEG